MANLNPHQAALLPDPVAQTYNEPRTMLVFGATGAIGSAVVSKGLEAGWAMTGTYREPSSHESTDCRWLRYDPFNPANKKFEQVRPFDAICWAQGSNMADAPRNFDADMHLELYRANCLFVMQSLADLLESNLLAPSGARLCVVSSIWQERARLDKFSYSVTKAAVGGIVRAASVDLAASGHLINGVLPGVLDTPMTRANLTAAQIAAVSDKTPAARLPDLNSLVETIMFLCSPANTSITGQSITVDLGFSTTCLV